MKIAIVGGGVSGLVTAHLLHPHHDLHLFEAGPTLGGHTHTVTAQEEDPKRGTRELPIDMGFIVHNDRNYPAFVRLLDSLGIERQDSEMSFSVRCDRTGLEYNGSTLNQLFAQRSNLLRPSFYRMVLDILRFHREAKSLLASSNTLTIGEFLTDGRYSRPFIEHYLVPMTAAIWSTDPDLIQLFPARTMASFLHNHGMLTVEDRPQWKTVRGGSRRYVDAIAAGLGERAVTSAPVERIRRQADGVELCFSNGPLGHNATTERFDTAVLAVHSDQALRLLADPTSIERQVLGAIPFQANEAVLHTDATFLPRRRLAWASWNYHLSTPADGTATESGAARLTYYMNRLQRLETRQPYLVTLNRTNDIAPEKVVKKMVFHHPLFTTDGIAAQGRWREISGAHRLHFCGAYWGWGFHEDGVQSALRVVQDLGVESPLGRPAADDTPHPFSIAEAFTTTPSPAEPSQPPGHRQNRATQEAA